MIIVMALTEEEKKERRRESVRRSYHKNKEKILERQKEYRENNKEKVKEYLEKNKEKIKEQRREYYEKNKEKIREYRENNREKIREQRKEYNEKNKEKTKEKRKERYEENKKNIKEQQREYREKNKENIKERQREYRENNKEKLREKKKERYEENKEKILEKQKERYEENKEKIIERNREKFKCKSEFCTTMACPRYDRDGYCAHCFKNLFPDDPRASMVHTKTKELRVRQFINDMFGDLEFIHDKPIVFGGCDCSSRRRIDHFVMIDGTLLAIETDEYQHKSYDQEDEDDRYNDILMHHSRAVFIRFNPDSYIDDRGKRRNPKFDERLEVLGEEIMNQVSRIRRGENHVVIDIVKLFYDSHKD